MKKLVVGGWWLVVGGWWLVIGAITVQAAPLRVGVINWDCSLPSSTFFGGYATKSLGPRQFRDRTPYYAQEIGEDRIEYKDRTVEEYEVEMRYALDAGIDYFAYCWYDALPTTNSVTTGTCTAADPHRHELVNARRLHLKSGLRDRLGLCAILVACGYYSDESLEELVAAMKQPCYEKIEGRPLVYVFAAPWTDLVDRLRRRCRDAGVANPYVVRMVGGGKGVKEAEDVEAYSTYACGNRAEQWDTFQDAVVAGNAARAESGKMVIPHWSVGWDPSPRNLHEVPWCKYAKHPYHAPATAEQLLESARKLRGWMDANAKSCVPGQLLVFAWNEFEEGGWICPNLGKDGKPDLGRSEAFLAATKVLKGTEWPEGKSPAAVYGRLADLLLSTDPLMYKPEGYSSPGGYNPRGYGGRFIHYAVVSLWVNALECARLTGDKRREEALIRLFEPFYGEKSENLPKFKHVDFTIVGSIPLEIAVLTGDERAKTLGLHYADMQWEEPKADDPKPVYGEKPFEERMNWWKQGYSCQTRLMIDDMYMINVLQGLAYRLTKDRKYIDRAAREMCLYLDRVQIKGGKDDGLFTHAPDVDYIWGRGAGWMAAGMPIILEQLPKDSEYYGTIMSGYLRMMKTLLKCQCPDGMWNQLVGDTNSWEETSGTAMFGFAFAMGVKNGWLDRTIYGAAARKAYFAMLERSDSLGNVRDVCCGTSRKNEYRWYLERPHVHGDPHGQCALMWMCRAYLEMENDK